MFNKQKKSKHFSLLHIISALEKEKIGDHDLLEEIKLDLEENIPLSPKKVEYLKEGIRKLKEIKNETKLKTATSEKDTETRKSIKPQKKKSVKKPWFGNNFGRKNKDLKDTKSQLSTKSQNSEINKQADEKNFLPDMAKPNVTEQSERHKSKNSKKISGAQKKASFFKFLSKKKKPQQENDKLLQNDVMDIDIQKPDKNIKNNDDNSKNITRQDKTVNGAVCDIDYELPNLDYTPELETSVGQTTHTFKADTNPISEDLPHRFEESHVGGIKQVLDELNKEKEMLRTDIEETKQLDDIKQLLEELSKEKEQLRTNVEEVKSRFSTKPLVEKYDKIERRLQLATDVLYSIQSDIYERIREIRILRKDLSAIKDTLGSL